jgi:signal peptidase I
MTRRAPIAVTLAIAVGAAAATAAHAAGVRPVQITTGSMEPAVAPGDWIVVRDGRDGIHRDDVVLFSFPLGSSGRAIKRVVAVAGDHIAIAARTVTVNGRVIPITGAPTPRAARARAETVPPGHVFLLGDNSRASIDSRSFGAVPTSDIVGHELLALGNTRAIGLWIVAAIAVAVGVAAIASTTTTRRPGYA